MKVRIQLLDDEEVVLAEYSGDASQPGGWRATSTQRLIAKMPKQSDNLNTGTYELFGFTYQPHVHVERPNGYPLPTSEPTPSPLTGPPSFPASFPSKFLPKRSAFAPASAPSISRLTASDTKLRG